MGGAGRVGLCWSPQSSEAPGGVLTPRLSQASRQGSGRWAWGDLGQRERGEQGLAGKAEQSPSRAPCKTLHPRDSFVLSLFWGFAGERVV